MRFIQFKLLAAAAVMSVTSYVQTTYAQRSGPIAEAPRMQVPRAESEIRRGLRFESFVDVAAYIPNKTELGNTGIVPGRGVNLNDAALYFTKEFGIASVLVDLPFNTVLTDSVTNGFAFAQTKAQAYFELSRGALVGKFGQFDTFFGVELNDSRDRFFAKQGIIKTFILPQTHSGVQVAYGVENVLIRGQVANPNGVGTMGKEDPEFAGQVRFAMGQGYGAAGFAIHDSRTAAVNTSGLLFNVMGGVSLDKFNIEGEFNSKKTPGFDKTATAFGLYGTYTHTPDLGFGGRFEYIKDAAFGGVLAESVVNFGFGPSYALAPDLTVRGDFSVQSLKTTPFNANLPGVNPASSDETLFGVMFSLVASL